ncbi:MAG TPA: proton-conducting transporter membrane subunit, partial [Aggregatilineaceae bacterium]|nr:proton-conducting transporter membrane subunit [Aggregatilineaceae bacterium]
MIPDAILPWILITFFVGGLLAWFSSRWGSLWPRWISFATCAGLTGLMIVLWVQHVHQVERTTASPWLLQFQVPWIPQFGISFYLGMDGVSLLLVVLSCLLGVVAVLASWKSIQQDVGFFHFNLLWSLAAFVAIFMALDLFLFYFSWEVMLVPLYFLISIWGHERRTYAAIKFFIFTQLSGLLMLVAILGLYFVHGRATGIYTFNYMELLGTSMPGTTAFWLMLGFFVAFAVKLPLVP